MALILKDLVKRKLDITWDDEDTEARIADIISIATPVMRHKLGTPEDFKFETEGQEQVLFLSYCLYEWNHAASEFDTNYLNDILQVRQKWQVEAMKDADEAQQV